MERPGCRREKPTCGSTSTDAQPGLALTVFHWKPSTARVLALLEA
jgi:hypothetical protein